MSTIEENLHYFFNYKYPNDQKDLKTSDSFQHQDILTLATNIQQHNAECASRQHAIMGIGGVIFMALIAIGAKVFTL